MRWRATPPPLEVIAQVVLDSRAGLNTEPAQRVRARAMEFDCETYLDTDSGRTADAKVLFQLLLLGIAPGEAVTVRCRGKEAQTACDAIVDVLVGVEDLRIDPVEHQSIGA